MRSASWLAVIVLTIGVVTHAARVPADAASFVVDSTADTFDVNPGDGACEDGSGNCTLRAAIMETNALPGTDVVTLPSGIYSRGLVGPDEDGDGDLDIADDLTIVGAGWSSTIVDGGAADGVFEIHAGVVVHISGVTIRNGYADFAGGGVANSQGVLSLSDSVVTGNVALEGGGGLYNAAGGSIHVARTAVTDNAAGSGLGGGGISNSGTLFVVESIISGNSTDGGGGIASYGEGSLTMINSVVSGNNATIGAGLDLSGVATVIGSTISNNGSTVGPVYGGGISVFGSGILAVTNSTISGNAVEFRGGGIDVCCGSQVTLVNVTFSENAANSGGGALLTDAGSLVMLKSTVVANSLSGGNCLGSVTSGGHNIDSDGSCGLSDPTDMPNADPLLGPLQDNGGFTFTHASPADSPAIDAIPVADCTDGAGSPVAADQRGVVRPQGLACDVGAYEVEVPTVEDLVAFVESLAGC